MFFDSLQKISFFGMQLIDFQDLGFFFFKFAMDIIFTLIVIRFLFYPIYKERDYVFTTILLNICIFLICFLMGGIKLKIGFAFGLFAVFSIIRYRTEQIPIREMTYMFIVIIIAVINALPVKKVTFMELFIANVIIVLVIYIIEYNFLHKGEYEKIITYEKIDLIRPENYNQLISDLKERTGFDVKKAEVITINFLNDTAQLKILFQYPDKKAKNKSDEA